MPRDEILKLLESPAVFEALSDKLSEMDNQGYAWSYSDVHDIIKIFQNSIPPEQSHEQS